MRRAVKHQAQKNLMKKKIQKQAFKERARETANASGGSMKKLVDKAEDMAGRERGSVDAAEADQGTGVRVCFLDKSRVFAKIYFTKICFSKARFSKGR